MENFNTVSRRANQGVSNFELIPILLLTGIFFLNFVPRVVMAPLMVTIEEELHLGHDDAGLFFFLISVGYFSSLLCSGFISSRISHRRTIALSTVLMGIVLLSIAATYNPVLIKIELFILGAIAGLYIPSGIAAIPSLAGPKNLGKALSIHELAPSLSFVAAPLLGEFFIRFRTWRWCLATLGIATLCMFVVYIRFGKGGNFRGEAPTFKNLKVLFKNRNFIIMLILFVLGLGASIGLYTMMPLYLVSDRGMDRGIANVIISLSRLLGLFTVLGIGFTMDRFGLKKTFLSILVITGIMTVGVGVLSGTLLVLAVFVQSMAAVCFFLPGWAVISIISSAATRNLAASLVMPAGIILGAGVIPVGIGFLGELGFFPLGVTLLGILVLTGVPLVFFLDLTAD